MSSELLVALIGFSFVSSITPGPNNLMLLASGVNYGFVRTVPHMLGIAGGFAVLLACVGLGLGKVLSASPTIFTGLKILCAAYLVFLAWRIAHSGPVESGDKGGRPMTFLQAAAFQWVNPKAWFMAVTSMAVYTSVSNYLFSVAIVVATFTAVNLPSISIWCGMGTALRRWLARPAILKVFNYSMALLLVATLWPILR